MTNLLVQNKKIKNSSTDNLVVYNFGIPAFVSVSGFKTCPMAGSCKEGCYAKQGAYVWPVVKSAYENRLEATFLDSFAIEMGKQIRIKLKSANRLGKKIIIRIHDSGDYYNLDYINKWVGIIKEFPDVRFYSYTKMVPLFKKLTLPDNLTIIYSEGGLADKLIDRENDRHARIFSSLDELLAAGYVDTTENDLNSIGPNKKVGLVYHGAKSKLFTTVGGV